MAGRAAVFLDGGYLDYVLGMFSRARIDYGALAEKMAAPNHEILRTYYYHCLPYQGNPATEEDRQRFSSAQKFFNRLRSLDLFEVREGRMARRGVDQSTGKPIFEQKRIDILLAVDLVLLAVKHRIDKASILTGDSDFIPAIEVAKNEGVMIELWHGEGSCAPHRELWASVDRRVPIRQELIDSIRR